MPPSWLLLKIQIYALCRSLGLKYVVSKLVVVFKKKTEARLIWQLGIHVFLPRTPWRSKAVPFEILANKNISQLSNQPCLILLFMFLLVRSSSRILFVFYFLTLVLASKARLTAFGSIFCMDSTSFWSELPLVIIGETMGSKIAY